MVLHKVLKIIALIAGIIGLFLLGWSIVTGSDTLESSASAQASIIDPFIYLTYIVFAITVVLVLVYTLKHLFTGNVAKTFLSIGIFLAVLVLGYLIAGDEMPYLPNQDEAVSASTVHWVSTGLVIFYILAIGAVGSMIAAGIKKLIK